MKKEPPPTPIWWVVFVLCVAGSFAANSTLAKLSYDHGATPLSVLTWRSGLAALGVFLVLTIWRVPRKLLARQRWTAFAMGAIVATYSYGLLGAMEHIPVALAVLTFYLYPLLTSLGAWASGQESMTARTFLCLIAAFIGLAIALEITGDFNMIGVSMAAGAAVLITVLLLMANRMVSGVDSRVMSLHMMTSATVVYITVDIVFQEFPLPSSITGMLAFLGSGVFYSFAMIGMFVGIAKIGAVRTTMFMNFEPVSSIFFGMVILGQFLAPFQLAGAGLVIVAIVTAAVGKRSAAKTDN